ncbi:MAG TPA: SDR family oxidoreductase [Acidimicrobiales bacterium]|nr:SDR family oxidoreductase [Acidimicrobiales bacterium]
MLVTGASRGIGEAIARACAEAGASVALVARSEGPLKELAAQLGGTAHPTDLTDAESVNGLIGRIEADGGPIEVLVNNAGIDLSGYFLNNSPADLEQIYRVNLLTPVHLCHQVLPGMLQRGRGHIVNVSSLAGIAVFPGLVPYSSTKAGLTHFTAGLRADLKGKPIGTTVVELGPIPTDMLAHVDSYRPTERSFHRFYQIKMLVDVPKEVVADQVVDAVTRNRRHVRIPKRQAWNAMLTEAPRRIVELALTGVKHQAD